MRALKGKNINLAARLAESRSKRSSRGSAAFRLALPVAALLLIIGGIMGWLWLKLIPEQVLAHQDTLAYLSNEENRRAYDDTLALSAQVAALETQCGCLDQALANLAGYPELNRDTYQILAVAAAATPVMLTALDYQQDSGVLALAGLASGAKRSADFAERLRLHGSFRQIAYYGYALGDGSYQFSLTCVLPGAEAEGGAV